MNYEVTENHGAWVKLRNRDTGLLAVGSATANLQDGTGTVIKTQVAISAFLCPYCPSTHIVLDCEEVDVRLSLQLHELGVEELVRQLQTPAPIGLEHITYERDL